MAERGISCTRYRPEATVTRVPILLHLVMLSFYCYCCCLNKQQWRLLRVLEMYLFSSMTERGSFSCDASSRLITNRERNLDVSTLSQSQRCTRSKDVSRYHRTNLRGNRHPVIGVSYTPLYCQRGTYIAFQQPCCTVK